MSRTQTQPTVRWGKVPFGAANWTRPSKKADIAAKAWSEIAEAASSSGARLMTDLPGLQFGKIRLEQADFPSAISGYHRATSVRSGPALVRTGCRRPYRCCDYHHQPPRLRGAVPG